MYDGNDQYYLVVPNRNSDRDCAKCTGIGHERHHAVVCWSLGGFLSNQFQHTRHQFQCNSINRNHLFSNVQLLSLSSTTFIGPLPLGANRRKRLHSVYRRNQSRRARTSLAPVCRTGSCLDGIEHIQYCYLCNRNIRGIQPTAL